MGGSGFGPGVGVGNGSPGVLACVAIIEPSVPRGVVGEPLSAPGRFSLAEDVVQPGDLDQLADPIEPLTPRGAAKAAA